MVLLGVGRQKQAASEVQARRKEKQQNDDGTVDSQPADVDRYETDVELESELVRQGAVSCCRELRVEFGSFNEACGGGQRSRSHA